MNRSKIHVQYRDGSKPKGTRVVLSFNGMFGGVTKAAYTDSYGTAIVEHESTGQADVIVSGKKCGSIQATSDSSGCMVTPTAATVG